MENSQKTPDLMYTWSLALDSESISRNPVRMHHVFTYQIRWQREGGYHIPEGTFRQSLLSRVQQNNANSYDPRVCFLFFRSVNSDTADELWQKSRLNRIGERKECLATEQRRIMSYKKAMCIKGTAYLVLSWKKVLLGLFMHIDTYTRSEHESLLREARRWLLFLLLRSIRSSI